MMGGLHGLGRLCAVWLSFVLILAFAGCACPQAAADYFAYTREGLELTVRAKITRTASDGYGGEASRAGESYTGKTWELVAAVTVFPPDEGDARAVSVTFLSPPALAGVTVSRAYGGDAALGVSAPTVMVSRVLSDGQTLRATDTEGRFGGLLRLADGWIPQGDVVNVSSVTGGARAVTVSTSDGGKGIYTFAEDERIPLRVSVSDPWGEIELVRDMS